MKIECVIYFDHHHNCVNFWQHDLETFKKIDSLVVLDNVAICLELCLKIIISTLHFCGTLINILPYIM